MKSEPGPGPGHALIKSGPGLKQDKIRTRKSLNKFGPALKWIKSGCALKVDRIGPPTNLRI